MTQAFTEDSCEYEASKQANNNLVTSKTSVQSSTVIENNAQ